MEKINEKLNLYGDSIAKVEQFDFSMANSTDEARTLAITTVATICTQKLDSIGSESLCTKLLTEAHGIPSSAYGFVPVLLNRTQRLRINSIKKNLILNKQNEGKDIFLISFVDLCGINIEKFGQLVKNDEYLLTNLRALVNDIGLEASKEFYNTDINEIAIIKEHFKVFKHKMDIRSARQFMRHTSAVWQELSRRYVSGKKVPFEFYISDKMKAIHSKFKPSTMIFGNIIATPNQDDVETWLIDTKTVIDISMNQYYAALEEGVKPQDARDILPLCTYTEIWSGWQPFALENMLKERTAIGTQWELRQTAVAMQELIKEEGKR